MVWQSFALPLIVSPFQHVASSRLPRTMPAAPGQGAAGLRRPGTQPSEIKPVLDRKICKVITAWEKLHKEMRSKHDRAY
jgi:hypothetical protein